MLAIGRRRRTSGTHKRHGSGVSVGGQWPGWLIAGVVAVVIVVGIFAVSCG